MRVGIEALGVAFPSTCLKLADLAMARGVAPAKYIEGLGTHTMGVAMPDEDTVTFAARAGAKALEFAQASGESIGMLAVGTETGVDHSKPVASFVQGLLGIGTACRVFETKHACYGGTAAVQFALDWVRSGSARGKKALVICSDIARYGLRTPGEPTQGAGAVALLISNQPTLVELEAGMSGVCSVDVHDFWRPLYSKDAFVDGQLSVQCYLDALSGAYRAYRELSGGDSNRFAAIAYHVPYGKMARKAHRQLRLVDGDENGDASFERMVAASLVLPATVGNIYTGSLYLALTSLLACRADSLAGERIGLFSYGSGFCAEFFGGTVQPGAQDKVRALGLPQLLEQRRVLSLDEYEAVMNARERLDEKPLSPGSQSDYRFEGVDQNRRRYTRPGTQTSARE